MNKTAIFALLICLTLAAASCGESSDPGTQRPSASVAVTGGATSSAGEGGSPSTDADGASIPPTALNSVLPAVDLIRVSTGETVTLSSLTPAETPLLLWFWAPH